MIKRLHRSQQIGLALVTLLLVYAVGGLWLLPADYSQQDLTNTLQAPGWLFPLGTDHFGRDMFSRLAAGIRLSFQLALFSVATAAGAGVITGVVAGWCRGWLDQLLNFVANIVLALPGLVLILLFAALLPGSFVMLYLAISLVLWVEFFRLVRAHTMSLAHSGEVQASYLMGFGKWYLFSRHIWPGLAADVFSLAAFGAATSIVAMSSVGFVYVGLKPPSPELGLMIVELFPYYHEAPWLLAEPVGVLFMMVLGFQLLGGKRT